ncbi:hypothetical protein, partial [Elioraea sp.]|uniref:hypothetical protein n=1 Tax=Elioraea sp. TaxID=2185103 RepID=UPI003F70E0F1
MSAAFDLSAKGEIFWIGGSDVSIPPPPDRHAPIRDAVEKRKRELGFNEALEAKLVQQLTRYG